MKYSLFIILSLSLICIVNAQFTNVQVSDPGTHMPEEVTIAINPVNPNVLAAGSNLDYFYWSTDAGKTWEQYQPTSKYGVWGDPVVIFDGLGNLYFAHLSAGTFRPGHWIDRIVVQKSTDNGVTFDEGVGVGYNPPKQEDKEWLAVDLTESQFKNNIYMSWTEFDDYGNPSDDCKTRILFSRSTDSGESWMQPITLSTLEGNCIDDDETTEGAVPTVGPNGEVYVSWGYDDKIYFDKSLDGGLTWNGNTLVTEQPGGWAIDVPGIYRCNGMPVTVCDISNSQYKGNIYINWSDQRNGIDDTDVFLIKSTDGGETWSDVIRVNNDAPGRHQFFSWMAVDQTSGYIYIVFYDRRGNDSARSVATDVYVARSTDGGDTFENFKVSESIFFPVSNIFFGDYTNIAAHNGKIFPIWMRMDNVTMDPELSVWAALIDDSDFVTSVESQDEIISDFYLQQNYPNPFNSETVIEFNLPVNSFTTLNIYDLLGRKIETLINDFKSKGNHRVSFNADRLTTGTYFYSIITENDRSIKKMIYLK